MTPSVPAVLKAGRLAITSLFFLTLLFSSCSSSSKREEAPLLSSFKRDTIQAANLTLVAENFQDSAQYDSALVYFQKAAALYSSYLDENSGLPLWKNYLQTKNGEGLCHGNLANYRNLARYKKALETLAVALEQGRKHLGTTHPTTAISADQIDRIESEELIDTGIMFRKDSSQYDSAIVYYKKAMNRYWARIQKYGDEHSWDRYLDAKNKTGDCHRRMAEYQKGLDLFASALQEGQLNLAQPNERVADSYYYMGITYRNQGMYDKALENLRKTLEVKKAIYRGMHYRVATVYAHIGYVYEEMGDYEAALKTHQKALSIRLATLDELHNDVISSYNQIGRLYQFQGAYERALEIHQKVLAIRLAMLPPSHPNIVISYSKIGLVHWIQGDHEKALANFQKALSINSVALGKTHPNLAPSYGFLGMVNLARENFDQALDNYQNSLAVNLIKYGENHPLLASDYHQIGIVHTRRGDYENALDNHQKALTVKLANWGKIHPEIAKSYQAIGDVYSRQGFPEKALTFYEKALEINLLTLGKKNPETADVYQAIGDVYSNRNVYEAALYNYQQSLQANTDGFEATNISSNPNLTNEIFSNIRLLEGLKRKAETLFRRYQNQSGRLDDLLLARQTYWLAVQLIDQMRRDYQRGEDKESLFKMAFPVYEYCVKINRKMYELTQQDSFLQQAFAAFEKSKSILLLETIQDGKAKAFYGLPDSLLKQEYGLNAQITFYEKQLFEAERKDQKAHVRQIESYQRKLFDLKRSRDSLLLKLEREYPDYYRLKHKIAAATISEVQDSLLKPEQALLEYFVGDSSIYIFYIARSSSELIEIPRDFSLESWVKQMQESLYAYHLSGLRSEPQYLAYAENYSAMAHQLYRKIFAPALKNQILPEQLIIVPDGLLAYLPFELLLPEPPENPAYFSSHSYLLKEYQISYCYSATLLQEMKAIQRPGKAKSQFLAFAPAFEGDTDILASQTKNVDAIRQGLGALRFNIPEARAIGRLMGGDVFTGSAATEEEFTNRAPAYRIIHLATHGKVNDQIGDYSFLAFSEKPDSIENELLYTRDLYNMQLHADMVVLSACETGLGELRRGEGVVSLARGFSYAGAKSIITTLWSINDAATTKLMKSFYAYIKKGETKDAALRQAKLDYLQSHPNDEAHPFFWGAFVAVGDMDAIVQERDRYWLWGFFVIGLTSVFWLFFKRFSNSSFL